MDITITINLIHNLAVLYFIFKEENYAIIVKIMTATMANIAIKRDFIIITIMIFMIDKVFIIKITVIITHFKHFNY